MILYSCIMTKKYLFISRSRVLSPLNVTKLGINLFEKYDKSHQVGDFCQSFKKAGNEDKKEEDFRFFL